MTAAQAQMAVPGQPSASAPLILRGVTVIDVREGRQLRNQQVEIVGNRIQAVASVAKVRAPRGAQIVDARGKYLIPGLWDMHTHTYGQTDIGFPLNLANGITGIRDLGSPIPLDTLGELKREIAAGRRPGPRLIVSGPHLSRAPDYRGKTRVRHVGDSTPEGIRRVVDSLHAAGADLIKTYFLEPKLYFAAAAETRRLGMILGGHGIHTPREDWGGTIATGIDGLVLSDSGATLLDHDAWLIGDPCGIVYPDSLNARCADAGRHFQRNGTWIVWTPFMPEPPAARLEYLRYAWTPFLVSDMGLAPPNVNRDSLVEVRRQQQRRDPMFRYGRPTSTADWRTMVREQDSAHFQRFERWREFMRSMPIVLGTDYGPISVIYMGGAPGFGLHEALVAEVLAGLTPLEALRTATLNPALALRLSDSLGTVETGKVADLVLLDADPLADIWNTTKIRAVVANGRYYDRAALDGVLAEAERAAAVTATTPP